LRAYLACTVSENRVWATIYGPFFVQPHPQTPTTLQLPCAVHRRLCGVCAPRRIFCPTRATVQVCTCSSSPSKLSVRLPYKTPF